MPNKRILLIEDDSDIVEMYEMAFKENGFDIESALTGNEAKEKIKEFGKEKGIKPDFILLDLILPDISGIEVLKEIRSNAVTGKIPVIVLSNYATDQIKKSIQEFGAVQCVLKVEITPQELVGKIEKILNLTL